MRKYIANELQCDVSKYLEEYNFQRIKRGKFCVFVRVPVCD